MLYINIFIIQPNHKRQMLLGGSMVSWKEGELDLSPTNPSAQQNLTLQTGGSALRRDGRARQLVGRGKPGRCCRRWLGRASSGFCLACCESRPFKTNSEAVIGTRWVRAYSLQSCPTLYDPMDWGPPHSSVHGILQARILEWSAMPSSRGSSRPRD